MNCDFSLCNCPGARKKNNSPFRYTFTYINEDLKALYYDIPKNASTTIRRTLFGPNEKMSFSEKTEGSIEEYFRFTFCRNPYSRVVSSYTMFTKWVRPRRVLSEFISDPEKLTFKEFCKFICIKDNHHWQTQLSYVEGYEIDFIGRVENFKEDFNIVCDKIGAPQQKPLHKNKSWHKHYTEYYDDETRKIVEEKYAKDIEYFGYKFGE
jgi:hypothetical protein